MGPNGAEPGLVSENRQLESGLSEQRWYALAVRSRCEKGVASELTRRGFETFLPVKNERRVWGDRIKRVEVAFFPGYVFVHSSLDGADRYRIVDLGDVICVVGKNAQRIGAPIPDHEIEAVRCVAEHTEDAESCELLSTGERVVVIGGPLRGIEGVVERVGKRQKIVCAITLLGRAVKATVSAELLIATKD